MKDRPWVPHPLSLYPEARKILGVLVPNDQKVTAPLYNSLYYDKILELIRRDLDSNDILPVLLRQQPRTAYYLENYLEKPLKPEHVVDLLENRAATWLTLRSSAILFLKGQLQVENLKEQAWCKHTRNRLFCQVQALVRMLYQSIQHWPLFSHGDEPTFCKSTQNRL